MGWMGESSIEILNHCLHHAFQAALARLFQGFFLLEKVCVNVALEVGLVA